MFVLDNVVDDTKPLSRKKFIEEAVGHGLSVHISSMHIYSIILGSVNKQSIKVAELNTYFPLITFQSLVLGHMIEGVVLK